MMDLTLIASLSVISIFIAFIIWRILKLSSDEKKRPNVLDLIGEAEERPRQRGPVVVGGRRQQVGRRPLRRRVEDIDDDDDLARPVNDSSDEDGQAGPMFDPDDLDLPDGKVGKKKLAKLQAKAEKRAQREYEVQEREERKQREVDRMERQKVIDDREKAEETLRKEEEEKIRKEQEARELEDYLAMKESFAVEAEGCEEAEGLNDQSLLQDFISHIKDVKVINMDELAAKFSLRTVDVIDRIKSLLDTGDLTGLIDDRGKFIYVTKDELNAVAKFINQRGRVSVQELVEYSNQLIRLEPLVELPVTTS